MYVPADTPIVPGHRYRVTFRVRGPAWGTSWIVDRAKERVWDELQRKGLRFLAWEWDGETFAVTFDRPGVGTPTKDAGLTAAVIGVAVAATLLILALTVALDKVEDFFQAPGGGGAGVGIAAILVLVIVALGVVYFIRRG